MSAKVAIFTVQEAHRNWCPFSLMGNRVGLDASNCLANHCMAWRWYATHVRKAHGELELQGNTYGFCGLAGEPDARGFGSRSTP